jgi:hypothetical protein
LKKFLVEQSNFTEADAAKLFVSPRDNEPYVINWGIRAQGVQKAPGEAPVPPIIIYEKTGADGTRYVANGWMSVRQLSDSEFAQEVPDAM